MSAKEMFEKIGYEFKKEKGIGIVYYKFVSNEDKENLCGYDWENKVTFFEKQVYIIDEKGIELVKENKKFFKTLPNDYTGTIEVENGYIIGKEILDKEEKEYLSAVIRPFRDRVEYIKKINNDREYIRVLLEDGDELTFPYFEKGTMYEGMEADKKYTLKELELDE